MKRTIVAQARRLAIRLGGTVTLTAGSLMVVGELGTIIIPLNRESAVSRYLATRTPLALREMSDYLSWKEVA